jgi:translation initiation factor 5B
LSSGEHRLRQPIIVVLGHVDHGKTSLLDRIRGTAIVKKEPGEMTQEVGASFVPSYVIERLAEPLKKIIPIKLVIPGLLFIDTPGHELFSNLRRRGGSVADFAVLVIDIMEGPQKQTYESIEILRLRKVPFLIAANKIDRLPGWKPQNDMPFLESLKLQSIATQELLDKKIYEIVGKISELGLQAERFDRIKDFTRNLAIVPVSARTGEGIAELLALIAGLTQTFMKKKLIPSSEEGKGVVLEVKEEHGIGKTLDIVLYDGTIRKGDTILLAGSKGPIITKVKSILVPKPLTDIRINKTEYGQVEIVYAAAGIKIVANNIDEALAGSPLIVIRSENDLEKEILKLKEEVESIRINRDVRGVIVKADSLGTLEAIVGALSNRGIPIRLADIGDVSKRDFLEAQISGNENRIYGVILAFRVKVDSELEYQFPDVKIFRSDIIYQLIDDYLKWVEKLKEEETKKTFSSIILPGKLKILEGYVFRRSDPVIVGVKVLGGIIKPKYPLINIDGRYIGEIISIQDRKKSLEQAKYGDEVAISIKGNIMVGRHINEGDLLYTDPKEDDIRLLIEKFRERITPDMLEIINELVRIKSINNPIILTTLKDLIKKKLF